MNASPIFGERFTKVLASSADKLAGVLPEWVLTVLAFESGLDPHVENDQGARGLWQRLAGRAPNGDRVFYAEADPACQLADAFIFWRAMMAQMRVTWFPTLEHFYCLNLAPARLAGDKATPATVLYDWKLHPLDYVANRRLDPPLPAPVDGCYVGLDNIPRKGQILLSDLGSPLRNARITYSPRIARELAALSPPPSSA